MSISPSTITEAPPVTDIDEAAKYYVEEASLDVALRFLDAVEEAYKFVCSNPNAGSRGQYRSWRLEGIRRWPVPSFQNYLVFYRLTLTDEWVEIVRVLHGARDIEALFEAEE